FSVFCSAVCRGCCIVVGRRSREFLWSIWSSFTSSTRRGSTTGTSGWTLSTSLNFLFWFWMLTKTLRTIGSSRKKLLTRSESFSPHYEAPPFTPQNISTRVPSRTTAL
ncbi:hypothetical protein ILYODFUR_038439, partial [Ilyodon furcidens]